MLVFYYIVLIIKIIENTIIVQYYNKDTIYIYIYSERLILIIHYVKYKIIISAYKYISLFSQISQQQEFIKIWINLLLTVLYIQIFLQNMVLAIQISLK